MKKLIVLSALFCVALSSCVAVKQKSELKFEDLNTGDLLFLDLDCGELCDAIEDVTKSYNNLRFSHVGIVYKNRDSIYVLEAYPPKVCQTWIGKFAARTPNAMYCGRIKSANKAIIPDVIQYCLSKIGKDYDDVFLIDNDKYYCSEFVYDAFKTSGNNIFKLNPMTFICSQKPRIDTVWQNYYKEINQPIPEGKLGINPGLISLSNQLQWMKKVIKD